MAQVEELEEKLKEFYEVDGRLCQVLKKLIDVQVYMLSQNAERFGPWYKDSILQAGSQREGAFYARMFLHGKHINEVDCMFIVGTIQDPKDQLQPIEHSPGYFSVKYNGILECFRDGIREKFVESSPAEQEGNNSALLAGSSVINMTKKMFTSTPTKNRGNELFGDILFQTEWPCKSKVRKFERKGPSVVTNVVVVSAGVHVAESLVDTVPCFKLSSWPDDFGFEEFRNRKRNWPSNPEDVESIQHKVHIVPKWSPKLKEESERDYCWRLSFSEAEIHLKDLFSDEENLVYLLFKILFYANIKKIERNGKTMASYFCKTTMLWMMEEEGSELCIKNDLMEVIQMLFGKFKQFLNDGFIPNFFHPSNNLIEGYPQDLITECSTMAGNISQRPLDYLPSNFNQRCEHLAEVVGRIDELQIEDFLDHFSEYVKKNRHLIGKTLFELFGHLMNPCNWRGCSILFHPLGRALIRAWALKELFDLKLRFFIELCKL